MMLSNFFGGHGQAVSGMILLVLLGAVSFLYLLKRNKRSSIALPALDPFPTATVHHTSTSVSTSGLFLEENFDVFINHRGPDVKKGFVKKLNESLRSAGMRPFLDAHDIDSGHESWDSIVKAIRGAPVCICVFSPGYAESKWCLEELALILDLKSDKRVLPVFYNVKPAHLRRPDIGPLSKGLKKLSKRYGPKLASRWRDALNNAVDIFGEELALTNSTDDSEFNSRLEATIVHKLVKNVHQYLKYLFPITIDQRASYIVQFLQDHSDKACIMGIWGMGGIGKTTLSREIFSRMKGKFDKASFLFDVAKIVTESDGGLKTLQTQLLSDLTGDQKVEIADVGQGKFLLRQSLQSKRVLIVVDNVEHESVRNALCIDEYLGIGSCCLITSRSSEVCSIFKTTYNYEVELLKSIDAKQLFCWHAFGSIFPRQGFLEVANKVSSACGGLPLALVTMGALLKDENDMGIWEEVLSNLRRHEALEYHDKLFHQLKLSFDSLEVKEKDIFLDVACFLLGTDKKLSMEIWESSGWSVRLCVRSLERKCLLKVENNCLTMHDLLIDMGHKIVTMESRVNPGERSRLWMLESEEMIVAKQTTKKIVTFSLAESKIDLSDLDFKTMKSLRLLNLDGCSGDTIELPQVLRYLRWQRMPLSEVPSGVFDLRWLAALDLTSSKITRLWNVNSDVTFPELRALILVGCTALKELPNSITKSTHLHNMNLSGCTSLEMMPHDIGRLKELEILHLHGCFKLAHLPESIGCLTSLSELNLRKCSNLISLPESIGGCVMLRSLTLGECLGLIKLPRSVGSLCNLESLMATDCSRLSVFPDSMAELSSLKFLFIGGGELKMIPLFINHLAETLGELHVHNSFIESLPEFVFNLKKLQGMRILGCHLLQNIGDSISGLKNLRELSFTGCSSLERIPDSIGELTNLEVLDLRACQLLQNLPKTLGLLLNLQALKLNGCIALVEFPDAESLFNLSTSCRQEVCEFIQFRCERRIMERRYDIAEQDVKYIMTLRPGDLTFQEMYELIQEKKHRTPEASLSSDFEWLRQQAWQKVVVNDIWEAAVFLDRMVELDSLSEFALLCRATLRALVGDMEGCEADQKKLTTLKVNRKQSGESLPQLFLDSLKIWNSFVAKFDPRGALIEILKVESSEETAQPSIPVSDGKTVALPGKKELATSVWKPQPERAAALREQAQTMIDLGDSLGALIHLDAADRLEPDNVAMLHARGYAKFMVNDVPGAYRDYNRVLELDPSHAKTLVSRATMRQGIQPYDLEGALADCEKALAICGAGASRNSSIPLQMRGLVKCKMGDFDGALSDLDLSYQIVADPKTLRYKEGLQKWKLGDFEGALDDLGLSWFLLPDDSPLRYRRKLEGQ